MTALQPKQLLGNFFMGQRNDFWDTRYYINEKRKRKNRRKPKRRPIWTTEGMFAVADKDCMFWLFNENVLFFFKVFYLIVYIVKSLLGDYNCEFLPRRRWLRRILQVLPIRSDADGHFQRLRTEVRRPRRPPGAARRRTRVHHRSHGQRAQRYRGKLICNSNSNRTALIQMP